MSKVIGFDTRTGALSMGAATNRPARALVDQSADTQVWKGQLPLGAAAATSPVLFYRHGKLDITHVPQTPYVRARMGRRVRAFFWARVAEDGALELGDEAPDQPW